MSETIAVIVWEKGANEEGCTTIAQSVALENWWVLWKPRSEERHERRVQPVPAMSQGDGVGGFARTIEQKIEIALQEKPFDRPAQ